MPELDSNLSPQPRGAADYSDTLRLFSEGRGRRNFSAHIPACETCGKASQQMRTNSAAHSGKSLACCTHVPIGIIPVTDFSRSAETTEGPYVERVSKTGAAWQQPK